MSTIVLGADGATLELRFDSIGPEAFDALLTAHRPTADQVAEQASRSEAQGLAGHQAPRLVYNPDTFHPALIAASCVEPTLSVPEATALWTSDRLSKAERDRVIAAAFEANDHQPPTDPIADRLRTDWRFAAEMAACRHYRLPHSQFLALPEEDRAKMLAWEQVRREQEAAVCGVCGTEPSDWVLEDGRRLLEPAWILEPETCPGCDVLDAAQSEVPDADRHKVRFRFRRSTPDDFIET